MVRLRKLGSEFHSPKDFESGANLHMPYLRDMQAYQDYLDGDLAPLFSRMAGNAVAQDVTGAAYYKDTGIEGWWHLNLFQAVTRHLVAAVFERSPMPMDSNPAIDDLWKEHGPPMIRQARRAVEWFPGKGRGVLKLENRYPGVPTAIAVDPQYYIPMVDPINRDLTVGDAIVRLWYEGERLVDRGIPNRVTLEISVTEEQADISDGRLTPVNEVKTFWWAGDEAQGSIGSGSFADAVGAPEANSRSLGIWTFGVDDSIYKSMERNVYEFLLTMTHARTALTQDVRSTQIIPQVVGEENVDPLTGKLRVDRLRPQFQIPVDQIRGAAGLGYLEPPGPAVADAFTRMAEINLDNLAYSANLPPEVVGLNGQSNQSSRALARLQAVFRTQVIDIRDDLGKILSAMFQIITGQESSIGWEHEPYARPAEDEARTILFFDKGLISISTAQGRLDLPIEEVTPPAVAPGTTDTAKIDDGEGEDDDGDN